MKSLLTLSGAVRNAATRNGLANLRVEITAPDDGRKEPVARATTGDDGTFTLRFSRAYARNAFGAHPRALPVRILAGEKALLETAAEIRWDITRPHGQIDIDVPGGVAEDVPKDLPQGEPRRYFEVRGRITGAGGEGVGGAWVKAFDQGVGRLAPLGVTRTDDDGTYRIAYTSSDLSDAGKTRPDLLLRVDRLKGRDTPLASAPLLLNALDHEVVNLFVGDAPYRGRTEYERVGSALDPRIGKVDLGAIDARSASMLAHQAGLAPLQVAHYVKARREADRVGVSAEALYGLYRQGLPTDLPGLVGQDTPLLEQAVAAAGERNVISAAAASAAGKVVAQLAEAGTRAALDKESPEARPIREVLDLARLKEKEQEEFLRRYATSEAPASEFWGGVSEALGDETTDRLKNTLRYAALTLSNPALVRALQGSRRIRDPRDLVAFDAVDWDAFLREQKIPVPERVTGDTPAQRRRAYATALAHSVEAAYPSAVFARRWKQQDGTSDELAAFLEKNPDFRLGRDRASAYLAEHPDALAGIDTPEAFTADLQGIERLVRLAPAADTAEHVAPLFRDGIESAYQIKTMGQTAFMGYATPETEASYLQMYERAVHVSDVALNAYFAYGTVLGGMSMYVLPDLTRVSPEEEGSADLEALFGAQDYCACAHCTSALGPAAYLTDLLRFLDGAAATDGDTGLEKLFDRRPDLGNLELTCNNSHTPLPYIDLVNEVLENAIHPRSYNDQTHNGTTLPVSDEVPQTDAEADVLKANPEHLNVAAYDTLTEDTTLYPWALPFSLWREEAAIYLDHLGVPRHALIHLFRPAATEARAAEYLGLLNPDDGALANEVDLLTTPRTSAAALRRAWGVTSSAWGLTSSDLSQLDSVLTFSRQAEMDYDTVGELLETQFVNDDGGLSISFAADAPCSLAEATFSGLTNTRLDRIHRFVRLQRRLGWTLTELDQAFTALGASEITIGTLESLAHLHRLRARFRKLDYQRFLSWWGATVGVIDYEDTPSHYERVFLSRAIHNQPAEIEALFGLDPSRTELADTSGSLTDPSLTPLVLGATGLTEADLNLLIDDELGGDDAITLASLSHLYRVAAFCRALRLSVTEYRSLRVLSGTRALTEPGDPATPADTVRFLDVLDRLRDARVSIEELDYVLRHTVGATSAVPPQENETAVLLDEVRAALQAIEADQTPAEDEDLRASLEARLSLVLDDDPDDGDPTTAEYAREEKVQLALAIVDRTSAQTDAEQQAFIDANFAAFLPDLADAKATLLPDLPADAADAATELDARYTYVLTPLLAHLVPQFMDAYLVQKLAAEMDLESSLTEALLTAHLAHPSDAALRAIDYFKSDAFIGSTDEVTHTPPFADGYTIAERLYKIALVVAQVGLRAEATDFVFGTGPSIGWPDLAALPLAEASAPDAQAAFHAWYKLFRAYQFQARRLGEAHPVTGLLALTGDAAVARHAVLDALAEQTGWNATDVEVLAGPSGFDARFASEGGPDTDEAWLLGLDEAFDAIERTGVSAAQLIGWATDAVSYEQARAVRNATRARYDQEAWLRVAPDLRDPLREKQRDALQAYVRHHGGFENADALYAYYLLDTEMSACMITSRLRLALSSVQLFVQRVLMNLEADHIEFTREDADEWVWRKTYRVWEANRKVFLYPENWIEPELRDDKTPFFKTLEDALLQNEVDDANVEAAYLGYLRSLDAVAHLDVRALHHDDEAGVAHVFARTKGQPYRYFYRQWHEAEAYWTAWEELDLDIEGDHLIPVHFNRRLYLCWPTFEERAVEDDPSGQSDPEPPKRYYEVSLNWCEYRDGAWGGQQRSEGAFSTAPYIVFMADPAVLPPPSDFVVFPRYPDDRHVVILYVDLYWHDMNPTNDESLGTLTVGRFEMGGCEDVFRAGLGAFALHHPYRASDTDWLATQLDSDGASRLELVTTETLASSTERTATVLEGSHEFRLTLPAPLTQSFNANGPFFYAARNPDGDTARTFFVLPSNRYFYRGTYHPGWVAEPILGFEIIEDLHPADIDVWTDAFLPAEPIGVVEPVDPPPPDWFLDNAHGELVFDGSAGGPRVIDRGNPDALPDLNPEPALTPTTMMRMMAAGFAGDGGQAVEATALAAETSQTLMASLDMSASGRWMEASATGISAEAHLGLRDDLAIVDAVLEEVGTYTWGSLQRVWQGKRFLFRTFYHPYTCRLIEHLNRYGVDGILAPDPRNGADADSLLRQQAAAVGFFDPDYDPTSLVNSDYPVEDFDFEHDGAYSQYNWELFFHVPLLIAVRLMQNQRFAEAQRWFHYIFDPTEVDGAVPERFWKLKPFHTYAGETNIANLLLLLNQGDASMEQQVAIWEADPFDPHAIARLRTVAYMRTTVMKYLDNLIAWGDHLFRRDTMETLNEATQIYVLAAQILGRRPEEVDAAEPAPQTFNDLYPHLDDFSNTLMADLETAITVVGSYSTGGASSTGASSTGANTLDSLLYFCVPNNPQLLAYWDTVADRLFKLRNCMNIEGVRRSLALFDPPIDPAMLVRAAASGVDLSSALSDLFAPLPAYRFTFMAERAVELTRDVQALGNALLAALERKDAEALALLRAGHEHDLLKAIEDVRERAIEEAELAKDALAKAQAQADLRNTFYSDRDFINPAETLQLVLQGLTFIPDAIALLLHAMSAGANLVPTFSIGVAGFGGSPNISVSMGGSNVAGSLSSAAAAAGTATSMLHTGASMAGTVGSYLRRQEDWDHQAELAALESEQVTLQMEAADVRIQIAEKELANHQLQIEHAGAVYDFYRSKYTHQDLYGWLTTQISTLYFQAYQLAYDAAKRAERAFRHELGAYDASFIQFGYWDSLKKGLLSGDRLLKDIRRMQMAYVEKNTRRYEITKHVSLRNLNPLALVALRETGVCEFTVPEVLFDLDFPGQYGRRLKTVSLSIPCVAGPYTTISAKLTLLNSRIRINGTPTGSYPYEGMGDTRFLHDLVGVQSIAASSAQADSGLFELDFRDERYLPFEGTGAISTWRLELPDTFRQFDYDTLSDVVLHLRYTAREGGDSLKAEVQDDLQDSLNKILDILADSDTGLVRAFSLRHEFPDAFHQLLHPSDGGPQQTTLALGPEHFPYVVQSPGIDLALLAANGARLLVKPADDATVDTGSLAVSVRGAAAAGAWATADGLHEALYAISGDPRGDWDLEVTGGALAPLEIDDIYLVLPYVVS